ncbi:MAG: major royal jelly family protein [Gammaproteobacteria bacterium]|jgi:sugar lactone lactonase YvrE|nr:major royal jelly family protein [Gammaproteobacteria bacterium]MDH3906524.1 major royal jelly family protein [Gammaproteobacteria bacterium]MDH4003363.1 major royal jelly family protein [Gammaproteobacteria bacterium]
MKHVLLLLLTLLVAAAATAWIRYGGGAPYADLTGAPVLQQEVLEEVLSYPLPIGNVAVSATGRVFFTVHPEARPKGNKLLEFVDGAAVPYPGIGQQAELFDTVLGVAIDRQGNLWTIDHGNHGTRSVRLLAFDLDSGKIVHDHRLPAEIAPAGSFLQDLQVSADGRTIIIADASFWRKRPAIIVYDVESAAARRALESHPSVFAEKFVIAHGGNEMRFFGGLVALRGGVDGIALGPEWLYYGALSGSSLYRVRLRDLRDSALPPAQLARRVEEYSAKPLSDGFSTDVEGHVYVTDVEHNAIFRIGEDRDPVTLLRSTRVRWPDALSFGPDGWLYVADSALQEVVLQPQENIEANSPYKVFRFRPGYEGVPGQ